MRDMAAEHDEMRAQFEKNGKPHQPQRIPFHQKDQATRDDAVRSPILRKHRKAIDSNKIPRIDTSPNPVSCGFANFLLASRNGES